LQDLSFRHLKPWRYAILAKAVAKARNRRRDLIQKVQAELESTFSKAKIDVQISGREKTLFSIYKKMDGKHLSFAQVTDIYGFRLIVPSVIDCYTALGILHQMYKPVPGKFKDHIAIGKVNGYQSLHTTLVGPSGVNVEFQMRTEAMNMVAESGVAAHWLYKDKSTESMEAERLGTQWLQSLLDIQKETRDASEFWDHVKVDLFPDAVYVFTPKSQITPTRCNRGRFRLHDSQQSWRSFGGGQNQQPTSSFAHRAKKWRCGRGHDGTRFSAQPIVAWLCPNGACALQNQASPENHGAQ